MSSSTGTYPTFQKAAGETADKLLARGTPEAHAKAQKMREFEATFTSWQTRVRPSDDDQNSVITDFLASFRDAHDFLTR